MILKRLIAIGVILGSLGLVAADAQQLRNASEPAEFPPASFKGKQYVDSRGCTYVRAGIDGAVNWIPRVTRSRQHLCGQTPSRVAGATPTRATPKGVVKIELNEPATAQKKPVIKPAVRTAAATAPAVRKPALAAKPAPAVRTPAPQQVRRTAAVKPTPKPQVIRRTPVAQKPAVQPKKPVVRQVVQQQPQPVRRRSTCPNFTGISAQYAGSGADVRCGPQSQRTAQAMTVAREPVTVMRAGKPVTVQRRVVRRAPVAAAPKPVVRKAVPAPAPKRVATPAPQPTGPVIVRRDPQTGQFNAPPNTRVIPRHVYEQQVAAKVKVAAPKGYRQAWDDDRLNPKRAHMKVKGIQQTDLVWTRTLPRKLYIRSTGRVVNHLYPQLRYPYTSMKDQQRAMGLTTSSRSAPKAKAKAVRKTAPALRSGMVQVGLFGNPANARRAAQRLQAAGLPARIGRMTRNGKNYQIVQAGPIAARQLAQAVSTVRRLGYKDAYAK